MEIKEWRSLAVQSVTLFLAVIICCVGFSGRIHEKPADRVMAEEKTQEEVYEPDWENSAEKAENATKALVEERSDSYIRIPKEGLQEDMEVVLRNKYMESEIELVFRGAEAESITKKSLLRVQGYKVEKGTVRRRDPFLKKLVIHDDKKESPQENVISVSMRTKKLYEPVLFDTDDAYYISLAEPKKIYDSIVVIDAGHGGMDEGTSSSNGIHVEKDYTLQVVQELKKLLEKKNVKAYYTRLEDKEVTKADRTKLANHLQADLFISIHCNASSPGDTTAYGMETLYSGRNSGNRQLSNKRLAQIILDSMTEATGNRKRGVIKREQLYLLHHAKVPTTIVEIGYMSNKNDLKYITAESGRQKIAGGICDGIMKALEEK